MYFLGEGCEANQTKAFDMYQKAASQGNAIAQFNLGICIFFVCFVVFCIHYSAGSMYDRGEGCVADKKKAFEMFLRSGAQGNAGALFNLGISSSFSFSVGDVTLRNPGIMLNKGEGCPVDKKNAYDMFQRSAELGYPSAIFNLGLFVDFLLFFTSN
jgi:TPR repeat protein